MENHIINLLDENGNETEYEILDFIQAYNKLYLVLYEATGNDTEVLIVRVEETEDLNKSEYIIETNEKVVNEVYTKFKENNIGKIDFID